MGGQACVLYGAAEFSRDTDFAILAGASNLARLHEALAELQAEVIAIPPFEIRYLRQGHAIHFRCQHPEALRVRVDVMSKMRGVDSFEKLWRRRVSIELPDQTKCEVLSLPDLVKAKKTQRDKDWPMIRRLVEAHYFSNRSHGTVAQVSFWLKELRTPELLIELCHSKPTLARQLSGTRPLLLRASAGDLRGLGVELEAEQASERERDRLHWAPLRRELEALRHTKKG